MSKYSDSVKLCSASVMFILVQVCFDVALALSRFRFCMPTRESAGRRPTWRRSLRVTRPTVSHTKATSSSPRYITSLPTVRPAPSLCGTSSSRLRPWSVAAATSSATRTTSTKRRMLLLLAKVKSCPWCSKLLMTHKKNELVRDFKWLTRSFCNLFSLWSNKYVEIISFFSVFYILHCLHPCFLAMSFLLEHILPCFCHLLMV